MKINRAPNIPYNQWRKNLRRQFFFLVGGLSALWIAAGAFTVWLLAR